jgi:hypothetical protein
MYVRCSEGGGREEVVGMVYLKRKDDERSFGYVQKNKEE